MAILEQSGKGFINEAETVDSKGYASHLSFCQAIYSRRSLSLQLEVN